MALEPNTNVKTVKSVSFHLVCYYPVLPLLWFFPSENLMLSLKFTRIHQAMSMSFHQFYLLFGDPILFTTADS